MVRMNGQDIGHASLIFLIVGHEPFARDSYPPPPFSPDRPSHKWPVAQTFYEQGDHIHSAPEEAGHARPKLFGDLLLPLLISHFRQLPAIRMLSSSLLKVTLCPKLIDHLFFPMETYSDGSKTYTGRRLSVCVCVCGGGVNAYILIKCNHITHGYAYR